MNTQPTIGILPLYLKLYDDAMPTIRASFEPFLSEVVIGFCDRGVACRTAPISRTESEVGAAIDLFKKSNVDLIVTLHLAYSPSLAAASHLANAGIPILMLDTTMDESFGVDVDPARLMFNHGIHGVQDLASVLRRQGKPIEIVAGHYRESDVLDRAAGHARAAFAARALRNSKSMRIGARFEGMGDFDVAESVLRDKLGIETVQHEVTSIEKHIDAITDSDIASEITLDSQRFCVTAPREVHERSVRVGLALRKLIDTEQFSAFSMNFLAFDSPTRPANVVPFLEASKAMARGIGYAGEGDVLTACLVGALQRAFGETTFTEIFCPDWEGDSLFISHMGEVNPATAADQPLLCEKDFPWTPALNPVILTCAPKPGPATLVNLAPGPNDSFSLIVAPMHVLGDGSNPAVQEMIRGWIRPRIPMARFLEAYSRAGGTHHKALVLGDQFEALCAFGRYAGLEIVTIGTTE